MDSALFDRRRYPVVGAAEGYGEWAQTYDRTVAEGLDRPLLQRLTAIDWAGVERAADLACGTGRTGAFLKARGVAAVDGVDITAEMLAVARLRGAHDSLHQADVAATPLASDAYGLVTLVLADEHLPSLMPVYREAARLLMPGGSFLLVGYHSFFIMQGMPTHFHRADGAALTIESHVHLFADHFAAGQASRLVLTAMDECVIDEAWLATKPKWRKYLGWPVSFSLVLRKSV
jgi:SAM-dependent methyltransferase